MREMHGGRLRELRDAKGLRQSELAELIGRPAQSVSAYERDEYGPPSDVAARLDAALDADGEVLRMYGYAVPGEEATLRQVQEMVTAMADEMRALTERMDRIERERNRRR